jgi:hypothetical protein
MGRMGLPAKRKIKIGCVYPQWTTYSATFRKVETLNLQLPYRVVGQADSLTQCHNPNRENDRNGLAQ